LLVAEGFGAWPARYAAEASVRTAIVMVSAPRKTGDRRRIYDLLFDFQPARNASGEKQSSYCVTSAAGYNAAFGRGVADAVPRARLHLAMSRK